MKYSVFPWEVMTSEYSFIGVHPWSKFTGHRFYCIQTPKLPFSPGALPWLAVILNKLTSVDLSVYLLGLNLVTTELFSLSTTEVLE